MNLISSLQTMQECKRSGLIDIAVLAFSGGTIATLLQILSDAVGAKRLKEEINRMQSITNQILSERDLAFNKEEICEDTVTIIKAKVEMYQKQSEPESLCYVLTEEILKAIGDMASKSP